MKEVLYLLPGLLCDRSLWRHQIEVLSQNYEVHVADFSSGDRIEAYADMVIDQAPEQFSLAALSMGAYVAFEIVKREPERVKRLALLDASPYADLPEHGEYRTSMMSLCKENGLGDVMEASLPLLIHSSRYQDEELVKTIDAMAHRVGVEGFLQQQTALLNRCDYFDGLKNIQCPTAIIVGRQDGMTPVKVSKKMHDEIPNSNLVEIENCGHLSTMEQPEAVTAVLRYWLQN